MKGKKTLFSLIGLLAVAMLFMAWVNYSEACSPSGGKSCDSIKSGDCSKRSGYGGGWCRSGGALSDICNNLPCPGSLLHKRDELGLNDNQVTQLKKLKSSSKKAKIRKSADIKILEIELKEILDAKSVDKKAMNHKIDAIGNLQSQIIKDCVDTKLTARELLTDEQLQKYHIAKKSCDIGAKAPSDSEKSPHQESTGQKNYIMHQQLYY